MGPANCDSNGRVFHILNQLLTQFPYVQATVKSAHSLSVTESSRAWKFSWYLCLTHALNSSTKILHSSHISHVGLSMIQIINLKFVLHVHTALLHTSSFVRCLSFFVNLLKILFLCSFLYLAFCTYAYAILSMAWRNSFLSVTDMFQHRYHANKTKVFKQTILRSFLIFLFHFRLLEITVVLFSFYILGTRRTFRKRQVLVHIPC